MTEFVTSADGTRIAYERDGEGSPVVVIGGIFCDRSGRLILPATWRSGSA